MAQGWLQVGEKTSLEWQSLLHEQGLKMGHPRKLMQVLRWDFFRECSEIDDFFLWRAVLGISSGAVQTVEVPSSLLTLLWLRLL